MRRRRLGTRRPLENKNERKKAVPSFYPDEGPCPLIEAYESLTRGAFAIWIRMSAASRGELRMGRAKLSRMLGYSRRQGDELLRELERKGFVAFVPHGPYQSTTIVVMRRPLLDEGHGFTRLASVLADFPPNLFSPVLRMHVRQQKPGESAPVDPANAHGLMGPVSSLPKNVTFLPTFVTQLPVSSRTYQCVAESIHKSLRFRVFARTETGVEMSASTPRDKRHKFVSEESYSCTQAAYIDHHRDLILEAKKQELDRRRLLRSSNRARRDQRNADNKARGIDVLDWNDLDLVTFDPRRPKHALMRKVLARSPRDPERVKLVKRLESEFCRLYSRYRRAAERAAGRSVVTYEVTAKERKYAAAAGVLCVQRGVTPRQLMEFWHANIKHFQRANHLQVPTLSFLSGVSNVDTVACGLVLDETAPGGARIGTNDPDGNGARPRSGNSFSDTARLDVRLRSGLDGAGFSTRELNDRYLLTVQKNAIAIAAGRDIFIGKGPLRDMSRWAASNLYAK